MIEQIDTYLWRAFGRMTKSPWDRLILVLLAMVPLYLASEHLPPPWRAIMALALFLVEVTIILYVGAVIVICALLMVLFFVLGLHLGRRQRLIQELPQPFRFLCCGAVWLGLLGGGAAWLVTVGFIVTHPWVAFVRL